MIRNIIVAVLFAISLSSPAFAQHWGGGGWHGGGGFHGGGGGFHGGGFHGGGGWHGGGFHGGGFYRGRGWGGPAIGLGGLALGLGALGAYEYAQPSPCPYGYYLASDGVCYPGGY